MTDLSGKRVAIIALDYFEEAELVEPREKLAAAGATVSVYSEDTDPIRAMQGDAEQTIAVQVDGTLADLGLDDFDALVVPGGTVNADRLRGNGDAQRLVRDAIAADRPTAVICHGPWVLIDAGVAEGRRMTSFESLAIDLNNAGATWVDEEVVVDGPLITSRNPDDLPAFIDAIVEAVA